MTSSLTRSRRKPGLYYEVRRWLEALAGVQMLSSVRLPCGDSPMTLLGAHSRFGLCI